VAANVSRLHPTLRAVARNLPRVAASLGFQARVTSGFRSYSKQLALYNSWLRGENPYPASPPGSSSHERGLAIDVVSTDTDALVSLLTSAGLKWYGPGDPVHFSIGSSPVTSQARKTGAYRSWREGPGAAIPSVAGSLPIVGGVFRILKDPQKEAKSRLSQLVDVALGFIGL
jgi:hypothetical protein